jgi:hypothetical protein
MRIYFPSKIERVRAHPTTLVIGASSLSAILILLACSLSALALLAAIRIRDGWPIDGIVDQYFPVAFHPNRARHNGHRAASIDREARRQMY